MIHVAFSPFCLQGTELITAGSFHQHALQGRSEWELSSLTQFRHFSFASSMRNTSLVQPRLSFQILPKMPKIARVI